MRCKRMRDTPTFAQSVVIIQTMPTQDRRNVDAIIDRHLALGFTYTKDQIYRAMDAVTAPARRWDQRKRASARST